MTTRYADVHRRPQGPGDARPTALQVIQDDGLQGGLTDKSVFITGASSGIGIETAKALFTTGATLYLTARNIEKARQGLGSELMNSTRVHLLEMDQNSLTSVRAALLAAATSQTASRAIHLSSIGHRGGEVDFENYNLDGTYDKWRSYSRSKTASLWTANEADRRFGGQGLRVFSVQPGGIQTGLLQHLSDEEQQGLGTNPHLVPQFKSPEQGAATTVWGAISKSVEGESGKYLEDVQIAKAWHPSDGQWAPGYAPHAYSPEKEAKLWVLSMELVGEES